MDLKHYASFDPTKIHAELNEVGERLKGSIDRWIEEKTAALKDASSCLGVLTEGLGGLLERCEHVFVRVVDLDRDNRGEELALRLGQYTYELAQHGYRPTDGPQMLQGKYRVFVLMERID